MQSVPSSNVTLSKTCTLVGRSRAGDGTTFVIPELKWMFDCGALVQGGGLRQPRVIWVTHTHGDHIFTLAHFAHQRELSTKAMDVYVPLRALPFVENYLKAYGDLVTMGEAEEKEPGFQLIGVAPNQVVTIRQGSKEFLIRVVECVHRIDCVGYSIFENKKKLKEEYVGLAREEIGKLRKQGVEIVEESLHPIACYLGDTTSEVFGKHPEILQQHSAIVVECSYLDEGSLDNAKTTMHMHWYDLKPFVEAHPETLFILTHFSLKYSSLFVREFFNNQKNNNMHPMLVEQQVEQEWNTKNREMEAKPPSCRCFRCQALP